jgi:hypothetical protein
VGHDGPVVAAPAEWLAEHGVQEWMGPDSLPLWISDPQWRGFGGHTGAAAHARTLFRALPAAPPAGARAAARRCRATTRPSCRLLAPRVGAARGSLYTFASRVPAAVWEERASELREAASSFVLLG